MELRNVMARLCPKNAKKNGTSESTLKENHDGFVQDKFEFVDFGYMDPS